MNIVRVLGVIMSVKLLGQNLAQDHYWFVLLHLFNAVGLTVLFLRNVSR